MALTPPEPFRFFPKNQLADTQLDNAVDRYAENAGRVKVDPFTNEKFGQMQKEIGRMQAKVNGLRNYWRDVFFKRYWNLAGDRLETEIGMERLSNPKTNYLQNGGFRVWNGAVSLPLGWTSAGSPTITRVAARTGAQGGNYSARIAAGGSEGSISRSARVKGGANYRLVGWVYLGAAASATITLTDNGASPTVASVQIPADVGTGGWFFFPRDGWDCLSIQTASDATSVTVKLAATLNTTVDFSDFQLVQGVQADPDMWEPAPEDIEAITPIGALPGGYGTAGQQLTTDGAGVLSWDDAGSAPSVVVKTANEQVSGSTTLQDDDQLLVAIAANETWSTTFTIKAGANLTLTGIKVAVTVPAGASIAVTATMTDTAGVSRTGFAAASGTAVDFTTAMFSAGDASITITANVFNAGNAGNITLQWAQSTAHAAQLTVYAGSSVVGVKA